MSRLPPLLLLPMDTNTAGQRRMGNRMGNRMENGNVMGNRNIMGNRMGNRNVMDTEVQWKTEM